MDNLGFLEQDGPLHPIPSMQGPFEESFLEAEDDENDLPWSEIDAIADPSARRQRLLDNPCRYNGTYTARWRLSPHRKYHPIWKLVAQISFGLHILQTGTAYSEADVLAIIDKHLMDLTRHLSHSHEDYDEALRDVKARTDTLSNSALDEILLRDPFRRASIAELNSMTEQIIDASGKTIDDTISDVRNGLDATEDLLGYLADVEDDCRRGRFELLETYDQINRISEDWIKSFDSLEKKAGSLAVSLVQLGGAANEMSKKLDQFSSRQTVSKHNRHSILTPRQVSCLNLGF